jgi:predicted DNA-binding transcriptional regulator AlpA
LLSAPATAAALGIGIETLYKRVRRGVYPRPLRLGHRRFWLRKDVRDLPGFSDDPPGNRVTAPQLATFLGVSVPELYRFIRDGDVPTPSHEGRLAFWSIREVVAHLARLPH